jgi:N6-adenosine-specific RNA methylase IME4
MILFPTTRYSIIYADPPWEVKAGPDWGSSGLSRPLPYPTMCLADIMALPVQSIAAPNAHLYLWTINKYIEAAYHVTRAWGFSPRCLLTWCKPKHGIGLGGTFIQTTEHLLFGRRGVLKAARRIDTTWFAHQRLAHSVKPYMFRAMIVEASGDLPRIELFARQTVPGWDCWGNEAPTQE